MAVQSLLEPARGREGDKKCADQPEACVPRATTRARILSGSPAGQVWFIVRRGLVDMSWTGARASHGSFSMCVF